MKRLWIITAVLLVAAIVGITVWHLLPAGDPTVSDLYRRYERQPGVRVGYIEDFRLDDSLRVDVVTVEALDSAGWQWMAAEFDFPPLDGRRLQLLADGNDVLQTWQCDDSRNFAFLSRREKALCIVQTASDREFEQVFMYHLKKLKE